MKVVCLNAEIGYESAGRRTHSPKKEGMTGDYTILSVFESDSNSDTYAPQEEWSLSAPADESQRGQ